MTQSTGEYEWPDIRKELLEQLDGFSHGEQQLAQLWWKIATPAGTEAQHLSMLRRSWAVCQGSLGMPLELVHTFGGKSGFEQEVQ